MLFHVTIDHAPETCPVVTNDPEHRLTPDRAAASGVKVVTAVSGRAQHRVFYVVETDDIDKLNDFLDPALSWAKCEITPVRNNMA